MLRSATGPAAAASCGRPSVLGLSVLPARVAELVYAMDSKSIVRKDLWVRVPPRALPPRPLAYEKQLRSA